MEGVFSMDSCLAVMKALADATRLRIIHLLKTGEEMCVCQIVAVLNMSQSTVSQHLGMLKRAGLVADRKERRWVFYRLHPALGPQQQSILDSIASWLQDDPQMMQDRIRWQRIQEFSPEQLCSGRIDETLRMGGNEA